MESTTKNQVPKKEEIATAYIVEKGKSRIVPLYDWADLKIVDEVLKPKKKNSLNKYFQPKKV
ncbi:hypothetical protein ES708_26644 [subsurface metagenome]